LSSALIHLFVPSMLPPAETLNQSASLTTFVDRVRSGDVRALARAITAIENDSAQASQLMKALFPHSGKATVIGLTGSPGSGKSTLVDQLAREYRKQEKTIGIIAVDPTSPYTGGAILGDRIRMQAHHADTGIYIRSMATRGFLGGLAPATADVATLLDAAGKDIVFVETVGVGQDEIDIVRLADVTVVILVPGMGDDVQTIKAGIMEIADIFVINKSDREGAERVEREIRAMQTLAIRRDDWTPPIVKTVASDGTGVPDLVKAIASYRQFLKSKDLLLRKRVGNWRERLVEMLRKSLLDRLLREQLDPQHLSQYAHEIAEHKRDPYSLVEELVSNFGAKHV
jgi:LAO/AO transport system kinase